MRLHNILSEPPSLEFKEINGFSSNRKIKIGKREKITGRIVMRFSCKECEGVVSFFSMGDLYYTYLSENLISLDCILLCDDHPGSFVPIWFLVQSEKNDIRGTKPSVRILKSSRKLLDNVALNNDERYGVFTELLEKAEHSYRDDLGAGSMVYLRIVLEQTTQQAAIAVNIGTHKSNGKPRAFSELIKEVDAQCKILPQEFSADGYRLFEELSEAIHGGCSESVGLRKYEHCRRLVLGVIDNIRTKREMKIARDALWSSGGAV